MSDRALLENAARAAGLELMFGDEGVMCKSVGDKYLSGFWNPLQDDGDALRLAVKLRIKVEPSGVGCSVLWRTDRGVRVETVLNSVIGSDTNAATRRAITRAAAAIWRAKK